jgi:hypothetical protein
MKVNRCYHPQPTAEKPRAFSSLPANSALSDEKKAPVRYGSDARIGDFSADPLQFVTR